ncbi:MAG: glycosyltransferase [Bacteroidales bacterium]|nr:glycosyltransferase [Bacteroidales bacterium]
MGSALKVLHVNYSDGFGGADIACMELHKALKREGIDSHVLVIKKQNRDSDIILVSKKGFVLNLVKQKISEYILKFQRTANPIHHSLGIFSSKALKIINKSPYNIIHLHWINREMLSIKDVAKINKPVIWTLHDSWPFCGTEHHPNILENDLRYKEGYSRDNRSKSSSGIDIDKYVWTLKRFWWKNLKIRFIAPSLWEYEAFKSSMLINHLKCNIVPNLIDINIFKPINSDFARILLNIPLNRKIILFSVASDPSLDKNKGFNFFVKALEIISKTNYLDSLHILILGTYDRILPLNLPVATTYLGFIKDKTSLAAIYNSTNVLVVSSMVESFGLTSLESISCGTPVVAFQTSGILDIIEHKKTGYLAKCFDINDLATGIVYLLENGESMKENCRRTVLRKFHTEDLSKQHIKIYEEMLG